MKGDFHVRICERLKLKCFGLLDRYKIPAHRQALNVRNLYETSSHFYFFSNYSC
jgi:hypothetical protein